MTLIVRFILIAFVIKSIFIFTMFNPENHLDGNFDSFNLSNSSNAQDDRDNSNEPEIRKYYHIVDD
jgi:hypothetical protein